MDAIDIIGLWSLQPLSFSPSFPSLCFEKVLGHVTFPSSSSSP
jgi:hypothetical protein